MQCEVTFNSYKCWECGRRKDEGKVRERVWKEGMRGRWKIGRGRIGNKKERREVERKNRREDGLKKWRYRESERGDKLL